MSSKKPVAVITGAANGIGLALTTACLKQGMRVVMTDKAEAELKAAASHLSSFYDAADIFALSCDVTKPEALNHLAEQTFQKFERVDWLFNNAGISGSLLPIWELDDKNIRSVMDVNLYGMIYGIKAFLPKMFQQSHRSRIINIASLYALCSGSLMNAYAMSKHAVLALSESLYFDLQRLGKPVDVSVACPSFVSTNLLASSESHQENALHKKMTDLMTRSRPAEEIADYIIQAVLDKKFYILPDEEARVFCLARAEAISSESPPHQHQMEKLVANLGARLSKKKLD